MPWAISLTTPTQDRQTDTHTLHLIFVPTSLPYILHHLHPSSATLSIWLQALSFLQVLSTQTTPYVHVPKCSRRCGVFNTWLSSASSAVEHSPLEAALSWTWGHHILWGSSSPLSSVAPCASLCPLHRVVPHCLALHASLFSLQGLCLGAPSPHHTSEYQLGADVSQTLLQPSSSSCAPQLCIRWTPRSQQVPNSTCPLTSTSPVSVSGWPQEPTCQARNLAIILEDKTTLPVKPTS